MSQEIQNRFRDMAHALDKRLRPVMVINDFFYEEKGFLSIAQFCGPWGLIKLLFGPAEWDVEVFIELKDEGSVRRLNLADLMGIDVIKKWILENRPDMKLGRLERQFLWIEQFLCSGLKQSTEFDRLFR